MFKMGLILSQQLPFTVAEKLFIQAIAQHVNVLGAAQQITISSVSSLIQRHTRHLFSKQSTKQLKGNEAEDDLLNNFVLVLKTENLINQSYFSLPEGMIEHIQQHKMEKIICVFKKEAPSIQRSIGSLLYEFISNFMTQDISKTACALVGSHVAASAFSMAATSPTLVGLPVYYFSEMGVAWLGGYIGGQGGQVLLGDYILGRILKRGQSYLFNEPQPKLTLPDIELNDTLPVTPAFSRVLCSKTLTLSLIETHFDSEIKTKQDP